MHDLGFITVKNVELPLALDDDHQFVTEFMGETYTFDSIRLLEWQMQDVIRSAKLKVPFVKVDTGRAGHIRGWHATQDEFLVTWDNGEKGRLRSYEKVVAPTEFPEPDRELLRSKLAEREAAKIRFDAEVKALTPEGGVQAKDLFNERFGEIIGLHRGRDRTLATKEG